MWMFGVDCVNCSGAIASRARMCWRALILQLPVFMCLSAYALAYFSKNKDLGIVSLVIFVCGLTLIVRSSLLPVRGLTDRLAGTYLVIK